jgi:hypothetical protein
MSHSETKTVVKILLVYNDEIDAILSQALIQKVPADVLRYICKPCS